MPAIAFTNFDNYLNSVLDAYVKENPLGQTITDKPLLAGLKPKMKPFVGGADYVSGAVRGRFLSDYSGFGQWYSHLDTVSYQHPDDILRWKYAWREAHLGADFDFTEFKQRGVSIDMNGGANMRGGSREVQIVKDWAKSEIRDNFGESQSRFMNDSLWGDGSVSAKSIIGITGILDDNPTAGSIGSISRATNSWWRHRTLVGANKIAADRTTQKACNKLKAEVRQLRKYGGRPDLILAGSAALEAIEAEVAEKVQINQDQFVVSNGKTAVGSPDLVLRGVGPMIYDPWLDDHGRADRIYILDSNHVQLRPMEGEDMKVQKPERPHDQYVILKAVTWTGVLCFDQLNCHGVYQIAMP